MTGDVARQSGFRGPRDRSENLSQVSNNKVALGDDDRERRSSAEQSKATAPRFASEPAPNGALNRWSHVHKRSSPINSVFHQVAPGASRLSISIVGMNVAGDFRLRVGLVIISLHNAPNVRLFTLGILTTLLVCRGDDPIPNRS